MKKLYFTLAFICFSLLASAQCFVQVVCTSATCYGVCDGSATAYPNGVAPFTYSWMPSGATTQTINGLCAGIYVCTITDANGCTATGSCTVTQPTQLQAMFTNVVNPTCPTCCDGSLSGSGSGGTPPYTYTLWPPSGPPLPMPSINNACNGTYVLCVTDANGCAACDTIVLSSPTQINEQSTSFGMNVAFINTGTLQVNANFGETTSGTIVVTNTLGQDVYRESFQSSSNLHLDIDLSGEGSGLYFVTITTEDGRQTRKILKS